MEELFKENAKLLYSYLYSLCQNESLAEELTQETFYKACLSIDRYNKNCKKIYERTKLEMLHTNASSVKEIDFFKKINTNVSRKNKVILTIIVLLFIFLIYCNLNLFYYGNYFAMYLNYLFPILVAGLLFAVLPDYAEHLVPNKIKFTVLGIEFASMTYILVIMLYTAVHLSNGTLPFGIEADKIGPLLQTQIYFVALCLLIAFAVTLFLSTRKKAICPALHFVPLGGLSLMLEYNRFLRDFTSNITLSMFVKPYVVFACEVIVLVGIYMFVNRKKVV